MYIFNHRNNRSFLFTSHLLINAVFFGDIKYFCIHIPHNSLTTPLALALAYEIFFYDPLHLCCSTRPSFLCKNSDLCRIFFDTWKKYIWLRRPEVETFFYIPSEQPNQAQFLCL